MNTCAWILDNDEPCGERCEGNTPFCGSHNRQLRKEEQLQKQATEKRKRQIEKAKAKNMEPRKTPNKVSEKQKQRNAEYSVVRDEFLKEHTQCEATVSQYCEGNASEVHHKIGRIGTALTDTKFFLAVCRQCHDWLHQHPLEALKKNFSESRLATEQKTI